MDKAGFYWHVRHNIVLEWCSDAEERVAAIKATKPVNEVPTRLRLMKPVLAKLPDELATAGEVLGVAQVAYDNATQAGSRKELAATQEVYNDAFERWLGALYAYAPELKALHAQECGCTEWRWPGLVFPGMVEQGSGGITKKDKS